jgi:hypothetical protein
MNSNENDISKYHEIMEKDTGKYKEQDAINFQKRKCFTKDEVLEQDQNKTLMKAHSGFQLIALCSNRNHEIRKRVMHLLSKREVQKDQEDIIVHRYNNSSCVLIIMTNAYSEIEQVSPELEAKDGENSIINERESIATLATIYMHCKLRNRLERIKLFTMLQPQFKEVLYSCMFSDYIRNLSRTRNSLSNVAVVSNFRIYKKEVSNTIALSQGPCLKEYEGFDCYIEEKLLKLTKLSYLKDTYMVPLIKFKNRIIYIPLSKFKRKY